MTAAARRPVRSAAAASFVAIVILISLGAWQVQRLHWKRRLLADIAHAEQAPPVPLTDAPAPFEKVVAQGTWRPPTALYGAQVRTSAEGDVLGAQLLQVLARTGAPPLLVDRGWVPLEGARTAPAAGAASVTGYVRTAEQPTLLSAEDDLAERHFYTLDPGKIGFALGAADVAPFTLVAMGSASPSAPVPATSLPRPPNNHLQYAFTWFGLAAALAGVFSVWTWQRRRSERE